MRSAGKTGDGIALDVAFVDATTDHEVAGERAPRGAPAVGHEPVIGGVQSAPANDPARGSGEHEKEVKGYGLPPTYLMAWPPIKGPCVCW